jgi:N-acetyl-gamma-glutamyl-phosphate reductase
MQSTCVVRVDPGKDSLLIRASIVGATGFTGAALTDILWRHSEVKLDALTSMSFAGRRVDEVFAHLRAEGVYVPYSPERVAASEVVFVCYPHAEAHPVVAECIAQGQRVVDLSADFRLREPSAYVDWYGFDHPHEDLVAAAVYGLPELHREAIRTARVVANPGCYPTSAILAVAPLAKTMGASPVIIDSKSGVSGAGRTATEKTHFCSVHDNFRAYSEVGHRHTAEMVQEMSLLAGRPVQVSFTPHLLPVDRGILSTVYLALEADALTGAVMSGGADPDAVIHREFESFYAAEPFVEVVRATPSLHEVRGTNYLRLSVRFDARAGLLKIVSVIDNLIKGASGQAVQNMNVMVGFPETMGLEARA